MTQSFPLQWPAGWPRTMNPQRARFDTRFASARDGIVHGLSLMGVGDWEVVISTSVPLRRDGLPYANQPEPDDLGVAVYFMRNGHQQCIPCDRWDRVRDNLQAVRLTIDALRGLDRWGARETVNAAFKGFVALPPPAVAAWPWRDVLKISIPTSYGPAASLIAAERAFRIVAKIHHPDSGSAPNTSKMAEANAAIAAARKEFSDD